MAFTRSPLTATLLAVFAFSGAGRLLSSALGALFVEVADGASM